LFVTIKIGLVSDGLSVMIGLVVRYQADVNAEEQAEDHGLNQTG
jgi:hypothetical protein